MADGRRVFLEPRASEHILVVMLHVEGGGSSLAFSLELPEVRVLHAAVGNFIPELERWARPRPVGLRDALVGSHLDTQRALVLGAGGILPPVSPASARPELGAGASAPYTRAELDLPPEPPPLLPSADGAGAEPSASGGVAAAHLLALRKGFRGKVNGHRPRWRDGEWICLNCRETSAAFNAGEGFKVRCAAARRSRRAG
jgi:hypothetical protein